MSQLYLVRHGQTLFNVLRRKQGWCDSPLTEVGIKQAHLAGKALRERGVTFDHFYSSPAERACDTLEIVLEELGLAGTPYERVKGLKEQNFGVFEGLTEDTNPPRGTRGFYAQFGGESEEEAAARMAACMAELMGREGHERVLAAVHGGVLWFTLLAAGKEHLARLDNPQPIPNAAILVCDWDGEHLTPVELIDPVEGQGAC